MKKIVLNLLLASLTILDIQATCLDGLNSLIVTPQNGSAVKTNTPIIIGFMKSNSGKPIKNKVVTLYVDNRKCGTATTNKHGVWSYDIKKHQALTDGLHSIQAHIKLASISPSWCKGTTFNVQADKAKETPYKSGNVNTDNSFINYPFQESVTNTTTPIIIGSLLDSSYQPVVGETVGLQIDASTIGNTTSDSNGVFSYALTTDLSETNHTIDAHCQESSADLATNTFTVDATAPDAPVIVSPTEDETITTSLVSISGSTEPWATITTFMDNDAYGDICYADADGTWLSNEYLLSDGAHVVTAQASDLGNNTGNICDERHFIVEEIFS